MYVFVNYIRYGCWWHYLGLCIAWYYSVLKTASFLLIKVDDSVENLFEDFRSGVKLLKLIESLTGEKLVGDSEENQQRQNMVEEKCRQKRK